MCQMHLNSDVQLWNYFSDYTHQKWMKFAYIVTGLFFLFSYFQTMCKASASASATSSSSFLNHNAYKEKLVKLSLLAFINHVVLTPSVRVLTRAQEAKTLKHDWEEGRTENSLLHKDRFWKKLIQWQLP